MRNILMGAAAILASSSAHAANDTQIVVAIESDIASTEFATKHDDATIMVLNHVMEGLVGYGSDLQVKPQLAESWSVSDDGRTYRFQLRDDTVFHNGAKLTAQIVQWNFERFLDPGREWGSHCREQLDGSFEEFIRPAHVIATRAIGDDVFEIELQSPSAMLLHHLASQHCIYGIVHPDSVDQAGDWTMPIGTGPYLLSGRDEGVSTTLARFANYRMAQGKADGLVNRGPGHIDRVVFQVIPDEHQRIAMLRTGDVDIVTDLDIARSDDLDGVPGIGLVGQITPAFLQLIPQSRTDRLLRKTEMRRAIAMTVNARTLAEDVIGKYSAYNSSAVATRSPHYTDVHRKGFEADADEVARLLASAGYAGEQLTIVTSRDPYPLFGRVADAAAARLNAAGINTRVETVDWGSHDARYAGNEYQLTTMAFSPRTDPALMYSAIVGQKGDHPWYLWEDQQAEMWVVNSVVETDFETRKRLFEQLHEKMLEWVPTIGIANYPRVDAISDSVGGYEGWTLGVPRIWMVRGEGE
ncbi:MAG: ABC transporter substrate-binding protein [Parvularcula sp.]|nr:ABC transporter substrate-binding protein [Parvularcula sp.]